MGTVRVMVPKEQGVSQVSVENQQFKVDSEGTVTVPAHFAQKLVDTGMGFRIGGVTAEVSSETAAAIKLTAAQFDAAREIQTNIRTLRRRIADKSLTDEERDAATQQLDAYMEQLTAIEDDEDEAEKADIGVAGAQVFDEHTKSLEDQIAKDNMQAHNPEITDEQRAQAAAEVERLSKEFEDRQQEAAKTKAPQPRSTR